ncbi:MAG: DUF1232 domain-containing protein [Chloroflexi bacterium]|nr:DUF1232 domain-containing protein [Chloroflexota bacterium]
MPILFIVVPFLKLVWRLIRDRRVPLFTKTIPVIALAYLVSPYDFIGDRIPLLGQFDGLIVVGLLLFLFVAASPSDVVADLTIGKKLRDLQDQTARNQRDPDEKIVDAKIRYIEDDAEDEPGGGGDVSGTNPRNGRN